MRTKVEKLCNFLHNEVLQTLLESEAKFVEENEEKIFEYPFQRVEDFSQGLRCQGQTSPDKNSNSEILDECREALTSIGK